MNNRMIVLYGGGITRYYFVFSRAQSTSVICILRISNIGAGGREHQFYFCYVTENM